MSQQMKANGLEVRYLDEYAGDPLEFRVEEVDGKPKYFTGYAIRFNSLSQDLGGFRERIMPTAFDRSLKSGSDIRFLRDHDNARILGRTSAGTLQLWKDDIGIGFKLDIPDIQDGRELVVSNQRKDIRGMSFGFKVPKAGDRFLRENDTAIREVYDGDLREITATSIPAYLETSLQLRVDPGIVGRIPAAIRADVAKRRHEIIAMK